jgi:dynein heavy chain, axonemal
MPSVFEDHKKIVNEKTIEYQEMLRKRIEYFKRDLDLYWEQLQEYIKWGDLKKLPKYAKKATILDKK